MINNYSHLIIQIVLHNINGKTVFVFITNHIIIIELSNKIIAKNEKPKLDMPTSFLQCVLALWITVNML